MAYHFDIEDSNWGGYRPGAGRKKAGIRNLSEQKNRIQFTVQA